MKAALKGGGEMARETAGGELRSVGEAAERSEAGSSGVTDKGEAGGSRGWHCWRASRQRLVRREPLPELPARQPMTQFFLHSISSLNRLSPKIGDGSTYLLFAPIAQVIPIRQSA
jgi:hypothetical protein